MHAVRSATPSMLAVEPHRLTGGMVRALRELQTALSREYWHFDTLCQGTPNSASSADRGVSATNAELRRDTDRAAADWFSTRLPS